MLPKLEGAGTQPPDRPGGHFEHEDTAVANPALGVNRSVGEPDRRGRAGNRVHDIPLHRIRRERRRHVNGLFEKWTVQRIGFVEDRELVKRAVVQQSFDGEFPALDEPFDEHAVVRLVPLGPHIRRRQKLPQPEEGVNERRLIVGAHDTAAA